MRRADARRVVRPSALRSQRVGTPQVSHVRVQLLHLPTQLRLHHASFIRDLGAIALDGTCPSLDVVQRSRLFPYRPDRPLDFLELGAPCLRDGGSTATERTGKRQTATQIEVRRWLF